MGMKGLHIKTAIANEQILKFAVIKILQRLILLKRYFFCNCSVTIYFLYRLSLSGIKGEAV